MRGRSARAIGCRKVRKDKVLPPSRCQVTPIVFPCSSTIWPSHLERCFEPAREPSETVLPSLQGHMPAQARRTLLTLSRLRLEIKRRKWGCCLPASH
jgi:hypothetical protein